MDKIGLIELLNSIFIPLGYKRKGNSCVKNLETISKHINLQKSNYRNAFYINYGFNIRSLHLTTHMHVSNRLSSKDRQVQIIDNNDKTIIK